MREVPSRQIEFEGPFEGLWTRRAFARKNLDGEVLFKIELGNSFDPNVHVVAMTENELELALDAVRRVKARA